MSMAGLAASMNMAVPQPTDARVPCPVCRSPIHPIAGRCKHCKADIAAVRQVRPAAGAALPPLVAPKVRAATPPPIADHYDAPVPVTVPAASEPSQPILPPRPSIEAGGTASTRSSWKSWPILVILLATIAIIAAVILMAFPPSAGADSGKRVLDPPPAPERMDTNPGARSHHGGGDDQNNPLPLPPLDPQDPPPAPHAQIAPPAPPADPADPLPVPRHTPDPLPPADPDVDPDFGGLGGGGIVGGTTRTPLGGPKMDMMSTLLKHACDRAKACGSTDPTATMGCDLTKMLPPASPPTCPAAVRCFAKIDAMDCSAAVDATSMMMLGDCMQAMTSC